LGPLSTLAVEFCYSETRACSFLLGISLPTTGFPHQEFVTSVTGVNNMPYIGLFLFSGMVYLVDALTRTRKEKSKRH